ncbi:MAG: hypothetical protein RLZZ338_3197 [Cyanobacteriota bacterium]
MTGRGNLWTLPTGHFRCISGWLTCLSFIITGRLKSFQEVYCKHPLLRVTTAEESLKHRENPVKSHVLTISEDVKPLAKELLQEADFSRLLPEDFALSTRIFAAT